MKRIVKPIEMKLWDLSRIQNGIPSVELMRRAALGLKEEVLSVWKGQTVTCICGSGNNGGDGISLAWLLSQDNIPVRILLAGNPDHLTAESSHYLKLAVSEGVQILENWNPLPNEIIIDALFGIGLDRTVSGKYADLIKSMNHSGSIIISADIPSGLDAMTGSVLGISVRASITVTMQFIKPGMLLGQGPTYTGTIKVCKLDEDQPFPFSDELYLQEDSDIASLLPPRPFDSHKGKNGHALLCVGSSKYIGAALLSARSCLRTGCGILSVCAPNPVRPAFSALPEAITIPTGTLDWDYQASLIAENALDGKSAVGIGCGIGTGDASYLIQKALEKGIPIVIDADGLNTISRNRYLLNLLHEKVVITPHVGEMSRLLDCTVTDILADPLSAVHAFPCTVLLKGPTTIVSDSNRTVFCTEGSPALAKGGSGDVLTGIITALLSQGLLPFDAARAGTYLLGTNAKNALRILNERMLLASDIIDFLEQENHGKEN